MSDNFFDVPASKILNHNCNSWRFKTPLIAIINFSENKQQLELILSADIPLLIGEKITYIRQRVKFRGLSSSKSVEMAQARLCRTANTSICLIGFNGDKFLNLRKILL